MNQWKVIAAFLLLCAGSLRAENPKFHPVTDGGIGLARYRVAIDFSTAADRDAFVRQLLATCRCRQEPYAELGFEGVMIVATPAAAELLSRDARVVTVDEIPPLPAPLPPAAPVTPPPSAVEPTPVAVEPTVPAMSAVSNEAQIVVPSPTTDSTAFWSRAYGYDKSGNIVTAGLDQYAYDRLGRVTYADAGPGKKQQYTYDRYGNLLTIVENGNTSATVDLRPDPATNRISGNGNVIAAYDTAGRMTSATGLIAKYDGEDTVVESTIQNGTTIRRVHLYSAAGERVATLTMNNSGNELSSAWTIRDPGGKVLRRLTRTNGLPGSWRWDEDYIYRDGQMLAAEVATPAGTLHYHLDHLGTPRVITGNGGAVVGQHTYHAFGKEATDPIQEAEAQKFTGHERDAEFLDYMHARYYNAYWGRFLSVDPIPGELRKPQSWNLYAYVQNNPVSYTDPTGLHLYANTVEAQKDICTLVGPDCSKHISFAKDGKVSIVATASDLQQNEVLNLVSDLVGSSKVFGAWVGTNMPSGNKTLVFGDRMKTNQIVNLSTNPRTDIPARLNLPLPAGYDGAVGVYEGYDKISVGGDGKPVSRALVLFHELAENYQRTEKLKQYQVSHQTAIQREYTLRQQQPQLSQYTLGAGSPRNTTTVKP